MHTLRHAAAAMRGVGVTGLLLAAVIVFAPKGASAQQLFPPSFSSTAVVSAAEGAAYSYTVTVEDLDPLDTITITAPTLPAWLTLVDNLNRTATLSGVPTAANVGSHDVVLVATDGLAVAQQPFTITVIGANHAPSAVNDTYTTAEDTQLTVAAATGVLVNDTDEDGPALTAVISQPTANGTVALAADGSFIYAPNANFSGNDTFSYRANDGTAQSNEATVTISVSSGNDLPVAVADAYTTNEDTPLNVLVGDGVLRNDTDADSNPLTAALVTSVASGTLLLNADGSFTYTPLAGYNGTDTFTYQANDGTGVSNTATVTITVSTVNDPPTATADAYATDEDTALTVAISNGVLANDTDQDGDALTAVRIGNPTSGTLVLNANGSFTYTPTANFNGTATFTYQAHDGAVASATAAVTITVAAINDVPFITSAPARTVAEGVTYTYTLTANDADGNALAFAAPTLPVWLVFTPPATIAGTPGQDNVGVHDVTMTVSDSIATPVQQAFQVTVQFVDNAPLIAVIPNQTATEGVLFSLDLKPFVTDADTPATSIVYAASGPLPAGLALSTAGVLSGTVAPGTYTVRFTARDSATAVPGQLILTALRAGRADLSLAISAAPNPVAVNTAATWTLTITNNASGVPIAGFSLDATFTGDVPFRFDAPATAGCQLTTSGNDSHLVCILGALAGTTSTSVTLTGSGGFPGDVFANAVVAIVGGAPIDETPANDRATGSLSVAQRVSATPAQVISGLLARAAAAGDLNGDGFDDLAIATSSAQGTIVLLNVVDPANPNKRKLSTTPLTLGGEALGTDVALADLDRDSDLDVVVAAAAGAPNRVFRNSGGAFATTAIGAASEDSRAVAIGDLNGDAFPDLVFANLGASAVYLNQGAGTTFARTAFGNGDARDVVVVDLFGDALPEVVIANAGGDAAVYRNTAGTLQLEMTLATGGTTSVATADLNADGRADLVFSRSGAGATPPTNLAYLNTSGVRGAFFLADQFGAAVTSSVLLGDFDLDADADVFAVNSNGDQLYTNVGNASGTFALHPQQLQTADGRMAAAGKFSVDDRVDVAVIAGGGASVFFNDGAGNLGQGDVLGPTIALRGEPTVTLLVGDAYADAGATATDAADGDVSSRVTVKNPVDTAVIGSYTVTYDATDRSGNSATPATRTVRVQAKETSEGGGGGALGFEFLLLLVAAAVMRRGANGPQRPLRRAP